MNFLQSIVATICFVSFQSCKQSDMPISENKGMVLIPAGTLHMGGDSEQADPNEYPKHDVTIKSFFMDITEVTNQQFKEFVDATGYVTTAERPINWEEMKKDLPPNTPKPADSLLQPGALVFQPTNQPVPLNNPSLWWRWTIGANWKHPQGPNSNINDKMYYPVVQVSWEDATAYAKWAGKRLPTEAEYEWAVRGGKNNNIYNWGNELEPNNKPQANFFQGLFPYHNTKKDGFEGVAPVKSFKPNNYGLYDIAGNVWEWCSDWYDENFYKSTDALSSDCKGPTSSFNSTMPFQKERVIRGGSFLCSENYCTGYRNARRMSSAPDTGLNHTGFRCVKDFKK